jgi:acyl-CoA synthetase (AMP-forming)/AMP-acid ligase II
MRIGTSLTPAELEAYLEEVKAWAKRAVNYTGDVRNGRALRIFIAAEAAVNMDQEAGGYDPVRGYDDAKGRELIRRAQHGDGDADAALCAIASEQASPPQSRQLHK